MRAEFVDFDDLDRSPSALQDELNSRTQLFRPVSRTRRHLSQRGTSSITTAIRIAISRQLSARGRRLSECSVLQLPMPRTSRTMANSTNSVARKVMKLTFRGPSVALLTSLIGLRMKFARQRTHGNRTYPLGRDEIPASMACEFLLAILTLRPAPNIRESRVPSRRLGQKSSIPFWKSHAALIRLCYGWRHYS